MLAATAPATRREVISQSLFALDVLRIEDRAMGSGGVGCFSRGSLCFGGAGRTPA